LEALLVLKACNRPDRPTGVQGLQGQPWVRESKGGRDPIGGKKHSSPGKLIRGKASFYPGKVVEEFSMLSQNTLPGRTNAFYTPTVAMGDSLQTNGRMEWCIVRLKEDYNWWVEEADLLPEILEEEQWSILDPRQLEYVFDLLEPLRECGLQNVIVERAFQCFSIDKDLGGGRIRLVACGEIAGETEEKLFALPATFAESYGGYAEFLDHISALRVKFLNGRNQFAQQLTVSELEESVRDMLENSQAEGLPIHLFQEIAEILNYCTAGFHDDGEDDEDDGGGKRSWEE
jgi:hypothetical protein